MTHQPVETKRRALSPKGKVRILGRQDRLCALCQASLDDLPRIEFDHIQALVHGGDNSEDNYRALCQPCHQKKTAADVKANAKVKRLRGETKQGPKRKIQSRPFPSKEQRQAAAQWKRERGVG